MANEKKALHDQIVTNLKQLKVHGWTEGVVKEMGDALEQQYPGWRWIIQPDDQGHIINIFSLMLHDQWGYTIRYVDTSTDQARRMAIRAGGEILERFGCPRRPFQPHYLARIAQDRDGKPLPDCADRMTRQQLEQRRIHETARELEALLNDN